MKRVFLYIFVTISVLLLSSCEKECVCVSLENGSASHMYGIYSKKECQDKEDFYNALHNGYYFECSYGKKK